VTGIPQTGSVRLAKAVAAGAAAPCIEQQPTASAEAADAPCSWLACDVFRGCSKVFSRR